jgi:hypothetical protein
VSDIGEAVNEVAKAFAAISDLTAPIREATLGYRQMLIDSGMTCECADACSVQFHQFAILILTNGIQQRPEPETKRRR